MTELDEKITKLFNKMIKSWDKITSIGDGAINFDNGLSIHACAKTPRNSKERKNELIKLDSTIFTRDYGFIICGCGALNPDTDKLLFFIETPYRKYLVPEQDRHTYAKVLDTIEASLILYEEHQIENYINHFQ